MGFVLIYQNQKWPVWNKCGRCIDVDPLVVSDRNHNQTFGIHYKRLDVKECAQTHLLLWEELKESIEIEKNDLELYFSYIMIYC